MRGGGLKAAAATFLLCVATVSGCAGNKSAPPQQPATAGPTIDVPLRLADCTDWRKANAEQRLGTLHQLTIFAGGPVGSSELKRGPVLPEKQAYDILQRYCAASFARGFKLYKLYSRAAAFAGH